MTLTAILSDGASKGNKKRPRPDSGHDLQKETCHHLFICGSASPDNPSLTPTTPERPGAQSRLEVCHQMSSPSSLPNRPIRRCRVPSTGGASIASHQIPSRDTQEGLTRTRSALSMASLRSAGHSISRSRSVLSIAISTALTVSRSMPFTLLSSK